MSRGVADSTRIRAFLLRVGRDVREPTRLYLVGGATAVLHGWRDQTIDIDLRLDPEVDSFFDNVEAWKRSEDVNLEMASPADFLPELPGWRERSEWIARVGQVDVFHYDYYAQALSKIERDFPQDRSDVAAMIAADLVDRVELLRLFRLIEPRLSRFPAIDPAAFAQRVAAVVGDTP